MATTRKPATRIDAPAPSTAVRMRVWYEDGTSSAIFNPNKPLLLATFEAEWGHETPQTVPETMWLAWHALGRPGGDVDAWTTTVEDLENFQMELGKAFS